MLPFMKEIVEILFADGFLKVVFATTTFAIGLNMPARSVLFTKVYKFSGGDGENLIETSEYLQMAGRAGRRGKDQTGSCLITLDRSFARQMPTIDDFERLLENKGTPLESKLKLSYSMTMNVMKSDSIMIEDMLKVSWFESENEKAIGEAMRHANAIQ
jgi:superfamily II RNA helicase